MNLRDAVADELDLWQRRSEFNHEMAELSSPSKREYEVIAETQDDFLLDLLDIYMRSSESAAQLVGLLNGMMVRWREAHDETVQEYMPLSSNNFYRFRLYTRARVQQAAVDRLRLLLFPNDKANTHPDQEEAMLKNVKSLAGTGKDYCQFQIEVRGGAWGIPVSYYLVENGGCGGTKKTALTNFAIPTNVPEGTYTLQAKVTGGGCGEPKGLHVQFKAPVSGNRSYGWAFETTSPQLRAAFDA